MMQHRRSVALLVALVVPALAVGACFYTVPEVDSERTFPCESDGDCLNGYSCVAGYCSLGPAGPCADGTLAEGDACDDANPCTENETCRAGICQGASKVCDTPPGNDCIDNDATFRRYPAIGACLPSSGDCSYPPDDLPCLNCFANCLQACVGVTCDETGGGCRSGGVCVPGNPSTCSYDLATNNSSCDLGGAASGYCVDGNCFECTVPSHCDDGNPCTIDSCDAAGTCSHIAHPSGTPCTSDNNSCTNDVCDVVGECIHSVLADTTACDDGLYCNGTDSCGAGSCSVHSGDPCTGADGDPNCSESCDEVARNCAGSDPDGSACNDGIFCNGADSCSSGSCSAHNGDPCPGPDDDANCSEACNEAAGDCTLAEPDNSPCNDGTFCNGADTCVSGACSAHAGDPCPGPDNDSNCSESCDEAVDNCQNADPNGSTCSDNNYCTEGETCSGGICPAGTPTIAPEGCEKNAAGEYFRCSDNVDNDSNGLTDCADPTCTNKVVWNDACCYCRCGEDVNNCCC